MKTKNLILLFSIIFLFCISFVNGLNHGNNLNSNFTATSIKYDNNLLYLDIYSNDSINTAPYNSTFAYYNLSNNQYYSAGVGLPSIKHYYGQQPKINQDVYFNFNGIKYYIYQFASNTFPKMSIYYKNGTANWAKIATPYQNYNGDVGDSFNMFQGISVINNSGILSATYVDYSGGFHGDLAIFNFSGITTMPLLNLYTRFSSGLMISYARYMLNPSNINQDYNYLGNSRIEKNSTLTNVYGNCETPTDSWYSNDENVLYEICSDVLYRSTSLTDIYSNSINLAGYSSCNVLLNTIDLYSIDCINSTSCLIGGNYQYNNKTYSLLLYTNGNSCTNVYYNEYGDVENNTIYSITNDGTAFYYTGIDTFGYYGLINLTPDENTPICIDTHNICNNPIYNEAGLYCDVLDTEYCAVNCTNILVNGTTEGVCDNGLCENECNILGYKVCDSMTSFSICGNYDTDLCLEYNTGYSCMPDLICSSGECIANTGEGLTENSAFSVIPYSISDIDTTYTLDAINKILKVDTFNFLHVQEFKTMVTDAVSYSSRTCDYKEVETNKNIVSENINTSKNYAFSSTLASTGYLEIKILPQNLINTSIVVKDSLSNIALNITLSRNSANKELCIYENDTEIYCDYSINSYDDLESIDLKILFEFQSKTYTITTLFNRLTDNQISTQPKLFFVNDISSFDVVSENTTFKNYVVKTITQPKGFSTTLRNDYNYLPCNYASIGARVVRTYNNNNGISDFTNYYDYTININSLSNTAHDDETTGFLSGGNLSKTAKILIVFFIALLLFAICLGVGFASNNAIVGLVIGGVLAGATFIIFSLPSIEWIPAWVTITLIIIAVAMAIIGSIFLNKSNG